MPGWTHAEDLQLIRRVRSLITEGHTITPESGWETVAEAFPRHGPDTCQKRYDRLREVHEVWKDVLDDDSGTSSETEASPEKVEFEESENAAIAESKSNRITTLDDLIRVAEIDLETFEIEQWVANKWEVGMKHPDTGEPLVEPLFQVKAWLKRRQLVQQKFPPLTPTHAATPQKQIETKRIKGDLHRALVIPDSQNGYMRDVETGAFDPFHDRRCWDLALQMASYLQPEVIVLLGDHLDLPDWSDKFLRSPEMYWTTQPAIDELHWWLAKIRHAAPPETEIAYLEGNHEDRLPRAILNNLKAAYHLRPADAVESPDVLSVPHLLGLDSLDIHWVAPYPDAGYWINDNLVAEHGEVAKGNPGQTAGAVVQESRASSIFGHVHRVEMASHTVFPKRGPVSYRSLSLGTIARIGGPTPAQGGSRKQNWQQAIGVVDFEEGNGLFEVYPLYIHSGRVIWDGEVIEAQDRTAEIAEDTGWDFTKEV